MATATTERAAVAIRDLPAGVRFRWADRPEAGEYESRGNGWYEIPGGGCGGPWCMSYDRPEYPGYVEVVDPTGPNPPRPRDLDEIARRYPRLVRSMKWVACLSTYEAAGAIRGRRDGYDFGGEAVDHFGGVLAVLRRAVACRNMARPAYGVRPVGAAERARYGWED